MTESLGWYLDDFVMNIDAANAKYLMVSTNHYKFRTGIDKTVCDTTIDFLIVEFCGFDVVFHVLRERFEHLPVLL